MDVERTQKTYSLRALWWKCPFHSLSPRHHRRMRPKWQGDDTFSCPEFEPPSWCINWSLLSVASTELALVTSGNYWYSSSLLSRDARVTSSIVARPLFHHAYIRNIMNSWGFATCSSWTPAALHGNRPCVPIWIHNEGVISPATSLIGNIPQPPW